MAEDDTKKSHPLFGSAGMAAAGMIRTHRGGQRHKPADSPPDELPADPAEESDDAPAGDGPEDHPETADVEGSGDELSDENATHIEVGTEFIVPDSLPTPPAATAPQKFLRAGVIGHTGAGNFGHGLDFLFHRLDGVRLVAIADADEEGLDAAQMRTGAETPYLDYREMLEAESLDLVAVAPRETGERHEMVKAALEAGAHVICERPLARTLREADELIALAAEKNLKLAVLHPMRCDPHVVRLFEEREALIGELLEIKIFGMMDHRAGGEDLLVLGPHLFDLARLFAGEPAYCTAAITKEGQAAIVEDAHFSEKEDLGPVLGDAIHAAFTMDSGVQISYVSDQRLHLLHGPWGLEFVGTRGRVRLFAGQPPVLSILAEDDPASPNRASRWEQWPTVDGDDPYHAPVGTLSGNDAANRLVVADWLEAISQDRPPLCSGENARKALEMVHGVWQAGATMRRAYFPLANRFHPLVEEQI